ncbi:L,D-transpeptidase-like protein [Fluviicoccus keumensis]|uniref:L,D-transpeptidase-like protein n=1 Tax=Fluviicoccus keumensis TaxID=1435465 RepID=A0A4Q7YLX1_9GAMM|nr:L,D-transpeptidase family protein [Fluviicoccus keumensis]RZU38557.1 L,D-transpeptidase-like protein [Fluviicoccus keumensis]
MRGGIVLILALAMSLAHALPKADHVLVSKTRKTLSLLHGETVLATFPVAFGANPQGHKQQEGDERTPEGSYRLDFKKADSGYYRAIHISYPNAADLAQARARGVSPGGFVMIHGQRNGFGWASFITQRLNWTNGCIALRNEDMAVVWEAVEPGTPIEIRP